MRAIQPFTVMVFAVTIGAATTFAIPVRTPRAEVAAAKTYTNRIGMKFVWIPPGTFMMGSPPEEKGWMPMETLHRVTLTKGFFMSVHLVTQEQWAAITDATPSYFKGQANLPVESVSWNHCQEFAKALRKMDGKPYRLPTDAEWEYACRAGTTTPFYCGHKISTDQANFNSTGPRLTHGNLVNRQKTTPVGSFPPNPWGLYDMHGNLWQWCECLHGGFSDAPVVDPKGPTKLSGGHVMRGGCYSMDAFNCRSAARGAGDPNHGFHFCGFRLCFFDE